MVAWRERWGEGIVREFGMDLDTLLHLKWITNKDRLYSTRKEPFLSTNISEYVPDFVKWKAAGPPSDDTLLTPWHCNWGTEWAVVFRFVGLETDLVSISSPNVVWGNIFCYISATIIAIKANSIPQLDYWNDFLPFLSAPTSAPLN